MNRAEFLQGLRDTLSGEVPASVVRENLKFYDEYIQTETKGGRAEAEVLTELGAPRLIARTIIEATPGAGEGNYEPYQESDAGRSSYQSRGSSDQERQKQTGGNIHYYDLNKWYYKLLGVVLLVAVIFVVFTVVTGVLSLVIPLLPVIGVVILIMWFVRGSR